MLTATYETDSFSQTFSRSSTSSSASALKSSTWTGLIAGRSSSDCTPKFLRNSSVVPRRIGRPGASSRPSSRHQVVFDQFVDGVVAFDSPDLLNLCLSHRLLVGHDGKRLHGHIC